MGGKARVPREGGRLLGVHVRVTKRLGESAAPAVEVDGKGVRALLEQLALARRQAPGALELAGLGIPGFDPEGAQEVASERERVAHLALGLAGA